MKKNKIVSLLGVSLLVLSSCKSSSSKVGIFIYNGNDTFITELTGCMKTDLKSYKTQIFDASESQVTQNEQILNCLNGNYSYFLINTVDRLASSAIIEKCSSKNIPIIFFNREPLSEDITGKDDIYYVGTSAEVAGQYQAEMAADLFGNPTSLNSQYDKNGDGIIQLTIIKGEKGHQDAELRTKYATNRLRDLGYNIDILSIQSADWMRSEGKTVMKNMYETYGDKIELVLSNNDDMALGAIDYLVENKVFLENVTNEKQPFPIFGVDATDVGKKAIKEGYLSGTVLNDAQLQSTAIANLLDYETTGKDFADFPFKFTDGNRIYVDEKKVRIADLA